MLCSCVVKELKKLPFGCLTALLLAAVVWVALQFIFLPELEKDAQHRGHTLGEYVDRLFGR